MSLCCNIMCVFQCREVMAAATVNRPGGVQTTEKSRLILKGNIICYLIMSMTNRSILIQIVVWSVLLGLGQTDLIEHLWFISECLSN